MSRWLQLHAHIKKQHFLLKFFQDLSSACIVATCHRLQAPTITTSFSSNSPTCHIRPGVHQYLMAVNDKTVSTAHDFRMAPAAPTANYIPNIHEWWHKIKRYVFQASTTLQKQHLMHDIQR